MPVHGLALSDTVRGRRAGRGWRSAVLADAARMAALAGAALGIGWMLDGTRRVPLTLGYRSPAQRLHAAVNRLQPSAAVPPPASSSMDLEAFQVFVAAHKGVVIDARAAGFYRLGHVPGAVNLPRETFAADYDRQRAALAPHKTDEVAVYCTEADCPDAKLVAEALAQLGFKQLWVYQAGWEEWVQAGLPQEGSHPP